jgi:hypothetical protein
MLHIFKLGKIMNSTKFYAPLDHDTVCHFHPFCQVTFFRETMRETFCYCFWILSCGLWAANLSLRYSGATMTLLWRYSDATLTLLWRYSDATLTLLSRYSHATLTLLWRYSDATLALLWRYSDATLTLLWRYSDAKLFYIHSELAGCHECKTLWAVTSPNPHIPTYQP